MLVFALLASCAEQQVDAYGLLLERFSANAPGYGFDAYSPDAGLHFPMAYAQVASAEARRHSLHASASASSRAAAAAEWLVANSDLDGDGRTGWGLPFAWDAFADGSTNPAHTPYAITTALAIQALLDVYGQTRNELLLETAIEAADAYLELGGTTIGDELSFRYSLAPTDTAAVYNVTAMMMGQLQRLAAVERRFEAPAEMAARHLLNARRRSQSDRPFWPYSEHSERENDLVHASYIVHGLLNYQRYGGRLSIDAPALYASLGAFVSNEGITELPNGEQPARAWGVGAALLVTALMERELNVEDELSPRFHAAALEYASDPGPFYPRQAAHVLLGLAAVEGSGIDSHMVDVHQLPAMHGWSQ